ncbi:ferredoxin, partial [Yersinia pestis]
MRPSSVNFNKVGSVSLYITDECINCDVCEPV